MFNFPRAIFLILSVCCLFCVFTCLLLDCLKGPIRACCRADYSSWSCGCGTATAKDVCTHKYNDSQFLFIYLTHSFGLWWNPLVLFGAHLVSFCTTQLNSVCFPAAEGSMWLLRAAGSSTQEVLIGPNPAQPSHWGPMFVLLLDDCWYLCCPHVSHCSDQPVFKSSLFLVGRLTLIVLSSLEWSCLTLVLISWPLWGSVSLPVGYLCIFG